jgi:hypothetical protein
MKKLLAIFFTLINIFLNISLAQEIHDLEKWSTVVMVRSAGKSTTYYYLKKHNLSAVDEKNFLESLKNPIESKEPLSRIVAVKFHESKAPDSLSKSITEEDADFLGKMVVALSAGFQGFPK